MTEAARETTFLGLGSNLGDREANLTRAAELLSQRALSGMTLSGLYETDPVDFLEAAPVLERRGPGRDGLTAWRASEGLQRD